MKCHSGSLTSSSSRRYPTKLLHVQMEQFAGTVSFIANDLSGSPVHPGKAGEAIASENAVDS